MRKNCTEDNKFKEQAEIIRKRFQEKGYPKQLINNAFQRAKNLSQETCLEEKRKPLDNTTKGFNFITTYNCSHKTIRDTLEKHWHILQRDPFLQNNLPEHPPVTFRRPPTIKNILAPSRLRQHKEKKKTACKKGVFKCLRPRCKCCHEITHNSTTFKSTNTGETFPIKQHLTCSSSYVIYLIECKCGTQYVGRTTQQLSRRLNKHRENIKKKFLLQSVSRHCAQEHPDDPNPIRITPIDHVDMSTHNRFTTLKE